MTETKRYISIDVNLLLEFRSTLYKEMVTLAKSPDILTDSVKGHHLVFLNMLLIDLDKATNHQLARIQTEVG